MKVNLTPEQVGEYCDACTDRGSDVCALPAESPLLNDIKSQRYISPTLLSMMDRHGIPLDQYDEVRGGMPQPTPYSPAVRNCVEMHMSVIPLPPRR